MELSRKQLPIIYSCVFLNALGYTMIVMLIFKLIENPNYGFVSSAQLLHRGIYFSAVALGWGSLGAMIGGWITGPVADFLGRKLALLYCTALTTISFLVMAYAVIDHNILLLLIGNAINGLASNNQPVTQAFIADIKWPTPRECSVRMSYDTLARVLAMIAGPLMGQLLSRQAWGFNLSTPFVVSAVFAAATILLVWFFIPKDYDQHLARIKPKKLSANTGTLKPLTLVALLCISFLVQFANAQFVQYLYPFLGHLHFSWNERVIFGSLGGVFVAIGLWILYPMLSKKISLTGIIAISLFGLTLAMFAMITHNRTILWLGNILWSIGVACYFPPLLAKLAMINENFKGTIFCVNLSFIGFAWYLSGFTSVYLGKLNTFYPLYACLMVTAVALIVAGSMWIRQRLVTAI